MKTVETTTPAPVTRAMLPGGLIASPLEAENVLHRIAAFVAGELGGQLFIFVIRVEVPGHFDRTGERLWIFVRHDERDQLVRDDREALREVQLSAVGRERVSHPVVRPSIQVRRI